MEPKGNDMADELPRFAIGDLVETAKGAKFWGEITALDADLANPGCTVLAIDPDFAGTKHVYPLKQLRARLSRPSTAEAVAYRVRRYRLDPPSDWIVSNHRPGYADADGWECQPLYTHPSPQGGAEPRKGMIERALSTITETKHSEITDAHRRLTHPIGETGANIEDEFFYDPRTGRVAGETGSTDELVEAAEEDGARMLNAERQAHIETTKQGIEVALRLQAAESSLAAEKLRNADLTAISEAAVASLEQRVAALVGLLKPFADFAALIAEERPGWDHDAFSFAYLDYDLTMAPFRAARAASEA